MNNQKVLVVEDSPIAQKMVKFALTEMQYEVDVANTGNEAIQCARKNKYDIILMDIGLDDMTGHDVTEQIRQSGANTTTWIIALTAHDDEGTRVSCIEAGMDEFMGKPFTKEKFQEILEKLNMAEQSRKQSHTTPY